MDDGHTRRGKPTLHRQFDEATAVIAGDALLAQAFQVLADERTHLNPLVRAELIQELALAVGPAGMAAGQMFDLDEPAGAPELAEIIRTQYLKTGALITWAVLAGAMLARAPLAARNALRNYAYCLGLAFQIADDLLDATGDVRLGKDTGQDAAHNKATLVTLLGTAKARERANALVAKAKRYLGCFGGEAALLGDIADFAVTRTR
jgi:farnesyl diphosphate synthase